MACTTRESLGWIGALLILVGTGACGSSDDTEPAGPYASICQERADCLDDNPFATIEACSRALKSAADIANKSGECLQATQTTFECRANNAQCTNHEVTYDGQCESKFAAQQDACGESDDDPLVGTEDFEEICSRHKQCRTDLDFETTFGSYEQCVRANEQAYAELSLRCKGLLSDFFRCDLETFQCVDNQLESAERCDDLFEDFQSECDG